MPDLDFEKDFVSLPSSPNDDDGNYYKLDGFYYEDETCEVLVGYDSMYPFSGDIILPGPVKVIKTNALHNFQGTGKTLTLPSSLEKIEPCAFDGARFRSITIKPGLRVIGHDAFTNCEIYHDFFLPSTVTTLGRYAFSNALLGNINLKNVQKIEDSAFYNTEFPGKSKVIIGENIEFLGQNIFESSSINCIEYNAKFSIPDKFCARCEELEDFILNYPVESIGAHAFADTSMLKSFKFLEGLKIIHKSAFECSAIREAILPQSLSYIGKSVFEDSNLMNIYINPESKNLEIESCFLKNSAIEKLTIPRSVTSIKPGACNAIPLLKKLIIDADVEALPYIFAMDCSNLTDIEITSPTITSLERWAFTNTGITEVGEQFKNIKKFGGEVFIHCFSLEKAYIYDGILDSLVFLNCPELKYVASFCAQPNPQNAFINNSSKANIYSLSDGDKLFKILNSPEREYSELEEIKEHLLDTMSFRKTSKFMNSIEKAKTER